MSDLSPLQGAFQSLVDRHFATALREEGEIGWSPDLWGHICAAGFDRIVESEDTGGAGADFRDFAAILRIAGAHGLPVPLAQINFSNYMRLLLAEASGFVFLFGDDSSTATVAGSAEATSISGVLAEVPWLNRDFTTLNLLMCREERIIQFRVPLDRCRLLPGQNIAGEPVVDLVLPAEGVPAHSVLDAPAKWIGIAMGLPTLSAALLIGGASRRTLQLSYEYCSIRSQFGRPIQQFQSVQHMLAQLAATVEALDALADVVVDQFDAGEVLGPSVTALKVYSSLAADSAVAIAHQIHGAVGMTSEYELQRITRRLMAWSDVGGSGIEAARSLGNALAKTGAEASWDALLFGR